MRNMGYAEKVKNRRDRVKVEWSNCGELGWGGFVVVHRQIEKTSERYRGVNIDRRPLPPKFDYLQLLATAMLAEVCVLTPDGNFASLLPLQNCLAVV